MPGLNDRLFLVPCVGGRPVLGMPVHCQETNLNFEHIAIRIARAQVQSAIAVRLRGGNVVLESADDRQVDLLNGTQREIAVGLRCHDDSNRDQIVDLAELKHFVLRLSPDPR